MLPELSNYLLRLEDQCAQIREIIKASPPESLNWRPFEGSGVHLANSLAVLAAHTAGSEHFWIGEVVGGKPPTRDRDAEFQKLAASSAELLQILELACEETREIFTRLTAEDLDKTVQAMGRDVPVRWAIIHVIDHTALHLGHMEMTYQMWKGGDFHPTPVWHSRLPKKHG